MNRMKREDFVAVVSKGLIEPKISVVGCGGAGNNIVNSLYWSNKKVQTVAINTDEAKLEEIESHSKIMIGKNVTHGQSAGGFPEVGELCAEQGRDAIARTLQGSDIVFIVAGMGGGTGTGAAPVVAKIANDLGAVTFAIAINPFFYEGGRQEVAEEGIRKLKQQVKSTIVLENDSLLKIAGDSTIGDSFAIIERSINSLIGSLSERITRELQEQIRLDVTEAIAEYNSMNVAPPVSGTVPELIRAESMAARAEMPLFEPSLSPEFLSR